MMQEKKKKLGGQQGELMRALDITMDDLVANGEGRLTSHQHETTLKKQSYLWGSYLTGAYLCSFIGLVCVGCFWFFPTEDGETFSILLTTIIFAFILTLVLYREGRKIKKDIKSDLSENKLQTSQGILVIKSAESPYLELNDERLHASPDLIKCVYNLQRYIIHYLPKSKVILSMKYTPEVNDKHDQVSQDYLEDVSLKDTHYLSDTNS